MAEFHPNEEFIGAGGELTAQQEADVAFISSLGDPLQVLRTDATGTQLEWADPSGGGGTPAGSNTELQYNDDGAFGATTGLTWDAALKKLKIADGIYYIEFDADHALGGPTILSNSVLNLRSFTSNINLIANGPGFVNNVIFSLLASSGTIQALMSQNVIQFQNFSGSSVNLSIANVTTERDVFWPDKAGTIAFLDDVGGGGGGWSRIFGMMGA